MMNVISLHIFSMSFALPKRLNRKQSTNRPCLKKNRRRHQL